MKNGHFNAGHCQMLWADFGREIYFLQIKSAYKTWKLLKADNYLNRGRKNYFKKE